MIKKIVVATVFFGLSGLFAGEPRSDDLSSLEREMGQSESAEKQIVLQPLSPLEKVVGVDFKRVVEYLKMQGRLVNGVDVKPFQEKLEKLRKENMDEYKALVNTLVDPNQQPNHLTRAKKTPHELALEKLLGMLEQSTQESLKLNKEWMAAQGKAADRSFKTTIASWIAAPVGACIVTAVATALITYYSSSASKC